MRNTKEYWDWNNSQDDLLILKEKIKSFKEMIKSCFTYGGADKDSFYYERYILPYKKDLGPKLFEKVHEEYNNYLKNNYVIKHNVYTDHEDVSYNKLIKIKQDEQR
tara:strand:- start:39 stop:356 length:318 start_codon:yes stop_codon:yes gene_type:complete